MLASFRPQTPLSHINFFKVPNLHVNAAYPQKHPRKSQTLQPAHQHYQEHRKDKEEYSQRINALGATTSALRSIAIEVPQSTAIARVNVYEVTLYEAGALRSTSHASSEVSVDFAGQRT
jgi:hypothetical protein